MFCYSEMKGVGLSHPTWEVYRKLGRKKRKKTIKLARKFSVYLVNISTETGAIEKKQLTFFDVPFECS